MDNHNIVQRIACYIRVSSDEQKYHGLSPESQRQALRRYAEENNLRIVKWYEDLGVSGTKLIRKRPALQQMIKDAEAGEFDRICFIKLDRYFRSVQEYYECQKRLDAKNVTWTATTEKYDLSTASGRYWVNQKLSMAEYEAGIAGERVDIVNEYKVRTGQPLTGERSLGIAFTIEKDENGLKKVVKDPATKELVMDYINHFLTYHNKRKAHVYINNKYGTSYSYNALSKILTNTKIYGHYRGNDKYCEGYIDKETFDNIQYFLANNIKKRRTHRIYLFSGLIHCPVCGRKLAGKYSDKQTRKRPNGKTYTYYKEYHQYRCNHNKKDKICSWNKTVNEITLETKLIEMFNEYMNVYIESAKVEDVKSKEPNCVTSRIKQIKAEMTRLNNMYQKGRKSEDEYDREYEELETRLKELESHLEPVVKRDMKRYEELLNTDWRGIYDALTKENKQAFWRKYIKEIVIDKNSNLVKPIFF